MALDLNTALNSYGFVGTLANAIPDLRNILNQAIAGEWAPEQFSRTVNDSPWFKANAEAVRKMATLQAMDPATFEQNVANATDKVRLTAASMGRSVPDLRGLAYQFLLWNSDDQQIRAWIGANGTLANAEGRPDALTGDAAQLENHMTQLASNYGVSFTQPWLNSWVTQVQGGSNTLDGFESLMKARAKAQFPNLANQIDAGMTVRDIADPYIASYAQTLEVPETGVTLKDRAIQQALQQKQPDGTFSTQPMYDFVRKLKDDPRWDKTKNAQDEAYRFASRVGKDMGFIS